MTLPDINSREEQDPPQQPSTTPTDADTASASAPDSVARPNDSANSLASCLRSADLYRFQLWTGASSLLSAAATPASTSDTEEADSRAGNIERAF